MLSKIETDSILRVLAHTLARWRSIPENDFLNKEVISHYHELLCFLIHTGWNDGLAL